MNEQFEYQAALPRPYEIVLLSFIYFQQQSGQEIKIDEPSLVRCMMASNCPRRETAIQILDNMVREGFLCKDENEKPHYSRTELGIESTPPPSPGSTPRTFLYN